MKKITNKRENTIFIAVLIIGLIVIIPLAIYLDSTDKTQTPSDKREKHGLFSKSLTGKEKVKSLINEAYDACGEQDFGKAHECLDEIESLTMNGNNGGTYQYSQCKERVLREEFTFLLAQDDEKSAKRIVYLLIQSYDSYDRKWRAKDVLKSAKAVKNQYAIDILTEMVANEENE